MEDIFKKNVEQILVKVWIVQQMGLSLQYQITKKLKIMTNLQQFTELEIKLMEAIKETWENQGGYCTYLADAASFA